MTAATLTLRPRVYRRHQLRPDFLPTLLSRAYQVMVGQQCEWQIHEDQSGILIDDTDYILTHPQQRVLSGVEDWQMCGAVTTALVALLLVGEAA